VATEMMDRIPSALLLILAAAVSLWGTWTGLQMLISPAAHKKRSLGGLFQASDPAPSSWWTRVSDVGTRFSGLIVALGFFMFVLLSVYGLLKGVRFEAVPHSPPERARPVGPGWDLLAISLVALACGLYLLIRPDRFLRAFVRASYARIIRPEALPTYTRPVRMVGTGLVLMGFQTFYWWLERFF